MATPNFIFGSEDPAVTNARIRARAAMNTAKQVGYSGDVPRLTSNIASSGRVIDITPRSMPYRVGYAMGNGLSRLSALAADGTLGTVAAPALAGAGWALMTGSRWDNNGTTKQLADEMNQAFKAGLYVDDEGNYVDADTNEIIGPEEAAKRIDAVATSDTPVASNTEEGYSYPSSGDPDYKVEPAPMEPLPEPVVTKNPLDNLNGLSDADLAKAVLAGKYGNGADRKAALGDRYAAIQALVNKKLAGSTKSSGSASINVPLKNRGRSKWQRDMTPAEIEAMGYDKYKRIDAV